MDLDIIKKVKEPIFYVTNDVAHGIGLENLLPNFHIICLDDHLLVDYLREAGISVFCLEKVLGKKNLLNRNTGTILNHPLTIEFIKEKAKGQQPNILFFKPQPKIETVAKKFGFNLLGNSSELNEEFEDKVSFYELCQKEGLKVPRGEIADLTSLDYGLLAKKYGGKFVVQFSQGWAGNSTFFISDEEGFEKLKKTVGKRKIKICQHIDGRTLINNAIVLDETGFSSYPAVQIKPSELLTKMIGGTGGRQWPAEGFDGKNSREFDEICKMTGKIGRIMAKAGCKGFFGLDFIQADSGEIFLLESNPRLTASTPFFTKLEIKEKITPFLFKHVCSFIKEYEWTARKEAVTAMIQGSEIVIRNTQSTPIMIVNSLKPGIYDKKLSFLKKAYCLEEETRSDNFWLTTAAQGRIVNPEIEIAKINTYEPAADEKGNLKEEFALLVQKVKENIS